MYYYYYYYCYICRIDFRDPHDSAWGKESDDSSSDEDYVPSICLRFVCKNHIFWLDKSRHIMLKIK